jgi:hypothetical protein
MTLLECLSSNQVLRLNPTTAKKKKKKSLVLVVHTCNPRYSGIPAIRRIVV